jgi:hypothetical protein
VPPLISHEAAVVLERPPEVKVGEALPPVIAIEVIVTGVAEVKAMAGHAGVSPA